MDSCIFRSSRAVDRGGAICIVGDAFGSHLVEVRSGWCDAGFGGTLAIDESTVFWRGGTCLFVPRTENDEARNFPAADNIGTFTSVLNMDPLGGSDENINLVMHDYSGTGDLPGEFSATGTGYDGFGFGSGIDFNYGWMEFTGVAEAFEGGMQRYLDMTGRAYNDEVNGSITVGRIPAPGVPGLLAIGGLAGRRR